MPNKVRFFNNDKIYKYLIIIQNLNIQKPLIFYYSWFLCTFVFQERKFPISVYPCVDHQFHHLFDRKYEADAESNHNIIMNHQIINNCSRKDDKKLEK
jgi:hypothetical protein